MNTVSESLALALGLVTHADANLVDIVVLSLQVSLTATYLAAWLGLPLGAAIAVGRFPGRDALIVFLNAMMGLPPVVVGLVVYLLLSRSGPLGSLWPAVHARRDGDRADHPDHAHHRGAHAPGRRRRLGGICANN